MQSALHWDSASTPAPSAPIPLTIRRRHPPRPKRSGAPLHFGIDGRDGGSVACARPVASLAARASSAQLQFGVRDLGSSFLLLFLTGVARHAGAHARTNAHRQSSLTNALSRVRRQVNDLRRRVTAQSSLEELKALLPPPIDGRDFTTERPSWGDLLAFGRFAAPLFVGLALLFLMGAARGRPFSLRDLAYVLLTLALLHMGPELKWMGNRLWIWVCLVPAAPQRPALWGPPARPRDALEGGGEARQKAATRRNMRREERVTVQGPRKGATTGRNVTQGEAPPPPLQGAHDMPSRCPPDAKCQPQWHL